MDYARQQSGPWAEDIHSRGNLLANLDLNCRHELNNNQYDKVATAI